MNSSFCGTCSEGLALTAGLVTFCCYLQCWWWDQETSTPPLSCIPSQPFDISFKVNTLPYIVLLYHYIFIWTKFMPWSLNLEVQVYKDRHWVCFMALCTVNNGEVFMKCHVCKENDEYMNLYWESLPGPWRLSKLYGKKLRPKRGKGVSQVTKEFALGLALSPRHLTTWLIQLLVLDQICYGMGHQLVVLCDHTIFKIINLGVSFLHRVQFRRSEWERVLEKGPMEHLGRVYATSLGCPWPMARTLWPFVSELSLIVMSYSF